MRGERHAAPPHGAVWEGSAGRRGPGAGAGAGQASESPEGLHQRQRRLLAWRECGVVRGGRRARQTVSEAFAGAARELAPVRFAPAPLVNAEPPWAPA